jgi:hypothetical protein
VVVVVVVMAVTVELVMPVVLVEDQWAWWGKKDSGAVAQLYNKQI